MTTRVWKPDDRVRHAGRPEWGVGVIYTAKGDSHEGKPCQRITVRFDRAGLKTLSTAFADLRPASDMPTLRAPPIEEPDPHNPATQDPASPGTPTMTPDSEAAVSPEQLLIAVPEAATDPFTTPRKRLAATLDLYRFTPQGASLLDWAAMQTGMKDPMSRFNRHELEKHFDRFMQNLDAHLRKLARDVRRQDPAALAELTASAGPAARQALRRADAGR